jgi:hypothetical protein
MKNFLPFVAGMFTTLVLEYLFILTRGSALFFTLILAAIAYVIYRMLNKQEK